MRSYINRIKDNRKKKIGWFKNIIDIFYHLHKGSEVFVGCVLIIIFNFYLYRYLKCENVLTWIFVLSSEHYGLKIIEIYFKEEPV